jgi:uncharacterized membrane protein YqhA
MRRIFALTRYFILIPVVTTLVGAVTLMLHATVALFEGLGTLVPISAVDAKEVKRMAIGLIEGIDMFLIAIGAYVMSLSLYALFIDDRVPLPSWLKVNDLEDLKANLISIIFAVLAVLFLRQTFAWEGGMDILYLGAAIALIVGTLTFFVTSKEAKER